MNLRERMQHQNKNNSEILNNSNFDFGKSNREDQMYERSRRQCEEELYKRKSDLEQERHQMVKNKEKEANYALEKFNNQFEELRNNIIHHINSSLNETKNRFLNEIKEKLAIQTNEEIRIKNQIDELMNFINTHLAGLKKDHYREYISKVVVTDFDNPREEVKKAAKRLKYSMPYAIIDDKHYNCMKNDLLKTIFVQFGANRFEGTKSQSEKRPPSYPRSDAGSEFNLHQNRDRIKMGM